MASLNETSPLENYNSLADRHLVHFFNTPRIRNHLIQNGLITQHGQIVSETEYRVSHMKQEHRDAVVELFAQAVVDRAIEVERSRQYIIRQSLEELCKVQRVRRIRAERKRRKELGIFGSFAYPGGDQEWMDSQDNCEIDSALADLDDSLLKSLDPESQKEFQQYLLRQQRLNELEQLKEEHLKRLRENEELTQSAVMFAADSSSKRIKNSKRPHRRNRSASIAQRCDIQHQPHGDTEIISTSTFEPVPSQWNLQGRNESEETVDNFSDLYTGDSRYPFGNTLRACLPPVVRRASKAKTKSSTPIKKTDQLPSSRSTDSFSQEQNVSSASLHQSDTPRINSPLRNEGIPPLKSTCFVQLRFLGMGQVSTKAVREDKVSQSLADSEYMRPRQVVVEQQPSGTNTVCVFKGIVKPGGNFTFASRRVPGHPFSLTIFVDGVQDSRVSSCCEYRHRKGATIGGKGGHFTFNSWNGSKPCYKCQAVADFKKLRNTTANTLQMQTGSVSEASQNSVALFGPSTSHFGKADEDSAFSLSFDGQSVSPLISTLSNINLTEILAELVLNFFEEETECLLEEIPALELCKADLFDRSISPDLNVYSENFKISEIASTIFVTKDYGDLPATASHSKVFTFMFSGEEPLLHVARESACRKVDNDNMYKTSSILCGSPQVCDLVSDSEEYERTELLGDWHTSTAISSRVSTAISAVQEIGLFLLRCSERCPTITIYGFDLLLIEETRVEVAQWAEQTSNVYFVSSCVAPTNSQSIVYISLMKEHSKANKPDPLILSEFVQMGEHIIDSVNVEGKSYAENIALRPKCLIFSERNLEDRANFCQMKQNLNLTVDPMETNMQSLESVSGDTYSSVFVDPIQHANTASESKFTVLISEQALQMPLNVDCNRNRESENSRFCISETKQNRFLKHLETGIIQINTSERALIGNCSGILDQHTCDAIAIAESPCTTNVVGSGHCLHVPVISEIVFTKEINFPLEETSDLIFDDNLLLKSEISSANFQAVENSELETFEGALKRASGYMLDHKILPSEYFSIGGHPLHNLEIGITPVNNQETFLSRNDSKTVFNDKFDSTVIFESRETFDSVDTELAINTTISFDFPLKDKLISMVEHHLMLSENIYTVIEPLENLKMAATQIDTNEKDLIENNMKRVDLNTSDPIGTNERRDTFTDVGLESCVRTSFYSELNPLIHASLSPKKKTDCKLDHNLLLLSEQVSAISEPLENLEMAIIQAHGNEIDLISNIVVTSDDNTHDSVVITKPLDAFYVSDIECCLQSQLEYKVNPMIEIEFPETTALGLIFDEHPFVVLESLPKVVQSVDNLEMEIFQADVSEIDLITNDPNSFINDALDSSSTTAPQDNFKMVGTEQCLFVPVELEPVSMNEFELPPEEALKSMFERISLFLSEHRSNDIQTVDNLEMTYIQFDTSDMSLIINDPNSFNNDALDSSSTTTPQDNFKMVGTEQCLYVPVELEQVSINEFELPPEDASKSMFERISLFLSEHRSNDIQTVENLEMTNIQFDTSDMFLIINDGKISDSNTSDSIVINEPQYILKKRGTECFIQAPLESEIRPDEEFVSPLKEASVSVFNQQVLFLSEQLSTVLKPPENSQMRTIQCESSEMDAIENYIKTLDIDLSNSILTTYQHDTLNAIDTQRHINLAFESVLRTSNEFELPLQVADNFEIDTIADNTISTCINSLNWDTSMSERQNDPKMCSSEIYSHSSLFDKNLLFPSKNLTNKDFENVRFAEARDYNIQNVSQSMGLNELTRHQHETGEEINVQHLSSAVRIIEKNSLICKNMLIKSLDNSNMKTIESGNTELAFAATNITDLDREISDSIVTTQVNDAFNLFDSDALLHVQLESELRLDKGIDIPLEETRDSVCDHDLLLESEHIATSDLVTVNLDNKIFQNDQQVRHTIDDNEQSDLHLVVYQKNPTEATNLQTFSFDVYREENCPKKFDVFHITEQSLNCVLEELSLYIVQRNEQILEPVVCIEEPFSDGGDVSTYKSIIVSFQQDTVADMNSRQLSFVFCGGGGGEQEPEESSESLFYYSLLHTIEERSEESHIEAISDSSELQMIEHSLDALVCEDTMFQSCGEISTSTLYMSIKHTNTNNGLSLSTPFEQSIPHPEESFEFESHSEESIESRVEHSFFHLVEQTLNTQFNVASEYCEDLFLLVSASLVLHGKVSPNPAETSLLNCETDKPEPQFPTLIRVLASVANE